MPNVFICDDEPRIMFEIAAKVKSELLAADISTFSSGVKLLENLTEEKCDILLLDIDMPELDGLEIAARLGALSEKPLLDQGELVFYGSMENLRSRYTPIDTMRLKIEGGLPDPDDLPLKKYSIDGSTVSLSYNSNHITAAEILKTVLRQTHISEVSIKKPDLEDVISQLKGRKRE